MAVRIMSRTVRGRLYFQVADVLFPTFAQAACAWSAAEANRLDAAEQADELFVQHTEALAQTRRRGGVA
jgi:hypothetical protein